MNLQDTFAIALELRGEKRVQATTRKYLVYTRTKVASAVAKSSVQTFYFLGKSGALRAGRCATQSRPCSDSFKAMLLESVKAAKVDFADLGLSC